VGGLLRAHSRQLRRPHVVHLRAGVSVHPRARVLGNGHGKGGNPHKHTLAPIANPRQPSACTMPADVSVSLGRPDVAPAMHMSNTPPPHVPPLPTIWDLLQMRCGLGTYSLGGPNATGACTPCPVGRYGSTTGLASPTCTGLCPAGSYCGLGTGVPPLCPPGTYSGDGASSCTLCPGSLAYSSPPAVALSACTACTTGCNSTSALFGAYLCPPTSLEWVGWLDAAGVERNGSCLLYNGTAVTPSVAKGTCGAMGLGTHLLTTMQVWCLNNCVLALAYQALEY
jgi:hypothetical protein